jgi:hypothetical protein
MASAEGYFTLRSGRWRWEIQEVGTLTVMELYDPGRPSNKMSLRLPFSWRQLDDDQLMDLARKPELRLWLDGSGRVWRVAAVGPGTHYDFPMHSRHLLFDSEQAWAGITEFDEDLELGDLVGEELRVYRDNIRDLGGRRQRFRPTG